MSSTSLTPTERLVARSDIFDAIRYAAEDQDHGLDEFTLNAMTANVMELVDQAIYDVDPVGLVEIMHRCGDVSRTTVDRWRERAKFPQPRWTVGGRPAWMWREVEAWGRSTGRLREGGQWAKPGELVEATP
jgi:predicted DNA-binding transcriptional regulator AlpA